MTKMKGITCCGDCGYYNWKKHKCTRATDEGDARDKFYADCPLPDVVLPAVKAVPVVHGRWVERMHKTGDITTISYFCSVCNGEHYYGYAKYCPNCGAKMIGEVDG